MTPVLRAVTVLALVVLAGIVFLSETPTASAHRDGCHRWHSCPSDSGSYVCGDLGYTSECGGSLPDVSGITSDYGGTDYSVPTRPSSSYRVRLYGPAEVMLGQPARYSARVTGNRDDLSLFPVSSVGLQTARLGGQRSYGSGSTYDDFNSLVWESPGRKLVRVIAKPSGGSRLTASLWVTVIDPRPAIAASVSSKHTRTRKPVHFVVRLKSFDAEHGVYVRAIKLHYGGGNSATRASAQTLRTGVYRFSHAWRTAGRKRVVVKAVADHGYSATRELTVYVAGKQKKKVAAQAVPPVDIDRSDGGATADEGGSSIWTWIVLAVIGFFAWRWYRRRRSAPARS